MRLGGKVTVAVTTVSLADAPGVGTVVTRGLPHPRFP